MDISGLSSLIELTEQVNSVCDQIEEQVHGILVIRFTPDSFNLHWPGDVDIQDVNRWERALRRIEKLNAITIIQLSGTLGGPALDLVLATDYRIASLDLNLNLPINREHFWPSMAMHRLVNQVGLTRTRQLLMREQVISAPYALNIGLIDEISEDLSSSLDKAQVRFNAMQGKEMAIRRQLLLEATTTSFEDSLGTYLAACDRELRRIK